MEEMSKENKPILLLCAAAERAEKKEVESEKKEFESELTETRESIQELRQKFEGGLHLGDAEKRNSEGTIAELQTNPELMASENKPEKGNQRVEELIVENDRLKMHFEELSKRIGDLRETGTHEMNQQNKEIESLQGKLVEKNREFQEKHSELTKEKEEQGLIIEALQGEIASLRDEKSLLSQRLDLTSAMSRDISENCLKNYCRLLELEGRSLRMREDVAAAMLSYAEGTVQQNKMRKDMNKLLDDLQQIQKEKEGLDHKVREEESRSNAFLEELIFMQSSRKKSTSKQEHQIETSDIQSKHLAMAAMAKESRSQLPDTVKHMDVHPRASSRSVNEKPKASNVGNEKPKPKVPQENKKPGPKNANVKGKPSSTKSRF